MSVVRPIEGAVRGTARLPQPSSRDRSLFVDALRRYIEKARIELNSDVLVVGGMRQDAEVLLQCGFRRITLSNIEGVAEDCEGLAEPHVLALDAENIALNSNSYDIVFAHAVLHHCRSPHRALCEMLRVARRYIVMMEPHDSLFMNMLSFLRFSFPFELAAVMDNDYICGGVRNSDIPNFIYRWNKNEIFKTASSFLAEYRFSLHVYPYWDFNVEEKELASREHTRISAITNLVGSRNFIRFLRVAQQVLNGMPISRRQGNRVFCGIEKSSELRPWLALAADNHVIFNRQLQQRQLERYG